MRGLKLEQQPGSQKRKQKIQEAPPDSEEETLKAPWDLNEETQEMLLDPEETQEAPPDPEERHGRRRRVPRRRQNM